MSLPVVRSGSMQVILLLALGGGGGTMLGYPRADGNERRRARTKLLRGSLVGPGRVVAVGKLEFAPGRP